MTDAKTEILKRIRDANGAASLDPRPLHESQFAPPVRDRAEVVEQFADMVADYRAVVQRCTAADLPTLVEQILRDSSARSLLVPNGLDPQWVSQVRVPQITDNALTAHDLDDIDAVVSSAACAIADTGTIILDHTAGQGRRALTLVPDLHICVVQEDQILPDVPHAISQMRGAIEAGHPLTWISGPSATSDIELNRVEGVHGPRTLHVLIVGSNSGG